MAEQNEGANVPVVAVVVPQAKSVATLKAELMAAMQKNDTDAVLAIAQAIGKAEAIAVKAETDAKRAEAKAAFEATMAAIKGPIERIVKATQAAVKAERQALATAKVTGLSIGMTGLDGDDFVTNVKPSGPGVPTSAPRGSTGGGGRGRNVYVKDGIALSTRELLETPEAQAKYGDNALEPTGLTHRADDFAKANGYEKQKADANA